MKSNIFLGYVHCTSTGVCTEHITQKSTGSSTVLDCICFYGTIQFLTMNAPTVLLPVHKYRTGTIKNFEKVFLFFCIVPVTVLVQCKKQEKVSQYQYRKFAWYRIHTNRTYGTGIMKSSTTGIL